jgi:hypothetical protein
VKEARGVDRVEGAGLERRLEDVSDHEPHRSRETRSPQPLPGLDEIVLIRLQCGNPSCRPSPLAQTLQPERRGAAGVEYLEAPYISEEVQLAVGEGDKIPFQLAALLLSEWVSAVSVSSQRIAPNRECRVANPADAALAASSRTLAGEAPTYPSVATSTSTETAPGEPAVLGQGSYSLCWTRDAGDYR